MSLSVPSILQAAGAWKEMTQGCCNSKAISPQGQLGVKGVQPPAGPAACDQAVSVAKSPFQGDLSKLIT